MKIARFPLTVFVVFAVVVGAGCSTVKGRQNRLQTISFDANVPDVEILCSGNRTHTPGTLQLRPSTSHICTAMKEGYRSQTFRLRSGITKEGFSQSTKDNNQGWKKWTLGVAPLVGWTIDLPSGAMRRITQDEVQLAMLAKDEVSAADAALDKTADIADAIISTPKDLVDGAATAILDTTFHDSAQHLGITDSTLEIQE